MATRAQTIKRLLEEGYKQIPFVFSFEKYKKWCKKYDDTVYPWAQKSDGSPIFIRGLSHYCVGTDGVVYGCESGWEVPNEQV